MSKIDILNDIIFEETKKLSDSDFMKDNSQSQIAKCQTISKAVQTFINGVKMNMSIVEKANGEKDKINKLNEMIGNATNE